MDIPELLAEIKGKLGYPFVHVELDQQHEEIILRDTFRWFNSRKGIAVERWINVKQEENEYNLENDVMGVIDFVPEVPGSYTYSTISQDVLDIDYIPVAGMKNYSEFVQFLQTLERRREVFSAITSYEFIRNSGTPKKPFVRIFPVPNRDFRGMLLLRIKMSRDNLKYASEIDEEFVVRYGLTVAKQILISIRGKYADLPAAQGPVTLNYDRLAEDFATEREKLEIDIRDWQEPMGIFTDRAF